MPMLMRPRATAQNALPPLHVLHVVRPGVCPVDLGDVRTKKKSQVGSNKPRRRRRASRGHPLLWCQSPLCLQRRCSSAERNRGVRRIRAGLVNSSIVGAATAAGSPTTRTAGPFTPVSPRLLMLKINQRARASRTRATRCPCGVATDHRGAPPSAPPRRASVTCTRSIASESRTN